VAFSTPPTARPSPPLFGAGDARFPLFGRPRHTFGALPTFLTRFAVVCEARLRSATAGTCGAPPTRANWRLIFHGWRRVINSLVLDSRLLAVCVCMCTASKSSHRRDSCSRAAAQHEYYYLLPLRVYVPHIVNEISLSAPAAMPLFIPRCARPEHKKGNYCSKNAQMHEERKGIMMKYIAVSLRDFLACVCAQVYLCMLLSCFSLSLVRRARIRSAF